MSTRSSRIFPSGTVTLLFSDMEGSTELLKHLRDAYVPLLAAHHRIFRNAIQKWNGHEVGTEGDSFFVSFRRATDAINAAVEIQRELVANTWPDGVEVRVRMGLHTGEPLDAAEGVYAGIDVHRAARIAHIGHGGQVLLSETTSALARDDLPKGVSLADLGRHLLKDIDRPEHVRQLVIEGLPAEFPPLNSLGENHDSRERPSDRRRLFPEVSVAEDASQKRSIVVLPFENISPDQENEYFSDGLTEEIIADLSKIHDLRVISRTSAMMLKGTRKDAGTIGRELNVQYLLEGSVRKVGSNLRITAQLIDALDDTHLWAEKYSGMLDDVFEIQELLSRKIVVALKAKLSPQESRLIEKATVSPAAHEAYLLGRYHLNMATPKGFQEAKQYFEEAIEIENNYALAYAGLATAYGYLGWTGTRLSESVPAAKQASLKALEINEMQAEAHNQLGYVALQYYWDWVSAEQHIERAIELNPNSSQAWLHYHWYLLSQARAEESHAAITRAGELDPLSILVRMNQPNYYQTIGDYDAMLQHALGTLELAPYAVTGLLNAGWAYLSKRLYDDAVAQFEKVVELTGSSALGQLAYACAMAGQTDRALEILDKLKEPSEPEYIRPMQIAVAYIGLYQFDQAFHWLDKAYEEHTSPLMPYVRQLPMFDPVRDDPRYLDLIRRLNFQS